jgi:hypothetical protein
MVGSLKMAEGVKVSTEIPQLLCYWTTGPLGTLDCNILGTDASKAAKEDERRRGG